MRGQTSRVTLALLSALLVSGGMTSWVYAHSGAEGVTKERMDMMKGMADAMKTMGAMFKGEAPLEPAVIAEKAGALARHAEMIPDMTPEGSGHPPSEALPIIWQDWDGYVADAIDLAAEGSKLVKIADNGADPDAMRAQYVTVGKTCGACHDRFRKPEE